MGGIRITEIFISAKTLNKCNQVYLLTLQPPILYALLYDEACKHKTNIMKEKNRLEKFNLEVSELKRNEQLRFFALINKQEDLDPEFTKIVDDNFWDLL